MLLKVIRGHYNDWPLVLLQYFDRFPLFEFLNINLIKTINQPGGQPHPKPKPNYNAGTTCTAVTGQTTFGWTK